MVFCSVFCLVTLATLLLEMVISPIPLKGELSVASIIFGYVYIPAFYGAVLAWIVTSWWKAGFVNGLLKGIPVAFLLLIAVLVSQYGIEQVFEVGLAMTLVLAPLVWVGIKWALIIGALVVVANLLNSAINKTNRALDAVIRNRETLERIEQKLAELKIAN
jgi:hypothetical protein